MTRQEQEIHFDNFTKKQSEILLKKGNDYSNLDRLSNFKAVASIMQSKPELSCLNMVAVKVNRLANLFSSGNVPNNESVRDSIIDCANYLILLDALLEEKENFKL